MKKEDKCKKQEKEQTGVFYICKKQEKEKNIKKGRVPSLAHSLKTLYSSRVHLY